MRLEPIVKRTALATLLVLIAGASSAEAQPALKTNVCLKTYLIDHTKAPNDRTILFTMKDGSVYQSTLPATCPQLSFNGFSYVATPPEDVCGNLQSIRVVRSHSVCLLGPLVQIAPARPGG
jgi:hypothetical protein